MLTTRSIPKSGWMIYGRAWICGGVGNGPLSNMIIESVRSAYGVHMLHALSWPSQWRLESMQVQASTPCFWI